MFQAVLTPSTYPFLSEFFAPKPEVPAPRDLTREEIDQIALIHQRIAALLHGAKRHPLELLEMSEVLVSAPLEALLAATTGQIDIKVSQCLSDAHFELGAIGSIDDTLDPEDDAVDCQELAEQVLDEAANDLRMALHRAGACR